MTTPDAPQPGTPLPWINSGWDNFEEVLEPVQVIGTVAHGGIVALVYSEATTWKEANADMRTIADAHYIVYAANELPKLVAEIAKLKEDNETSNN